MNNNLTTDEIDLIRRVTIKAFNTALDTVKHNRDVSGRFKDSRIEIAIWKISCAIKNMNGEG